MQTARIQFIQNLFTFLEGRTYLCVKYLLDVPEELPQKSDLDILVTPDLTDQIAAFCRQQIQVCNLKTEVCGERHTLGLYFWDGGFLKIDLLTCFQWKGYIYLDAAKCFDFQQHRAQVQTYHCLHLLEHVFLYYFLNGSAVPQRYVSYFNNLPHSHRSVFLPYLRQVYQIELKRFTDLERFDEQIRQQLITIISSRPENSRIKVARRKVKQWADQARNLLRTNGSIITFSGVDGAGKTTILSELKRILAEERHQKVKVIRHRPGILPILSAWRMGKQAASVFHASRMPRQGTNDSKISSLLRFAYYYTDYMIGQWWIQLRYCALGYTVIYDRYYFDFIVDPRRSNLVLPDYLTTSLYRLLLPPKLNFFLYASPSSILSRKQELEEATIIQLTKNYRQLFTNLQNLQPCCAYQSIENEHKATSMQQILQWYNLKIA